MSQTSRQALYARVDRYADKLQLWQNYSREKGLELINMAKNVDREQIKRRLTEEFEKIDREQLRKIIAQEWRELSSARALAGRAQVRPSLDISDEQSREAVRRVEEYIDANEHEKALFLIERSLPNIYVMDSIATALLRSLVEIKTQESLLQPNSHANLLRFAFVRSCI